MDISLFNPCAPVKPAEVLPWARMVETTGLNRLWLGQAIGVETHHAFAAIAGMGLSIPVGIGVSLMPMQTPFGAAASAASLARLTGSADVCYGPGSASFQEAALGRSYSKPVTAAGEYLSIVRGLVRGEFVEQAGQYFSCRAALPGSPVPPLRVGLGVLRSAMARKAGALADVAVTWMTPASYIRETLLPALEQGAQGRERRPRLVAIVPIALVQDDQEARSLALASNRAHYQAPHYIDMLRRAGVEAGQDATARDMAQGALDVGSFVAGGLAAVTSAIREYEMAGVDELVINPTGVYAKWGPDRAQDQVERILSMEGLL